jgi:hypothetical protein
MFDAVIIEEIRKTIFHELEKKKKKKEGVKWGGGGGTIIFSIKCLSGQVTISHENNPQTCSLMVQGGGVRLSLNESWSCEFCSNSAHREPLGLGRERGGGGGGG